MSSDGRVGGLCHLVEAATALSKLVEAPRKAEQSASSATPAEKSVNISDDDDDSCKKSGVRCNKREIFPQRLLAILNDSSLSEIVTWLPNGRSFVIVRPDVFTETVLPKYLPPVDSRGSTKYPSFTRKLNRWGFRQITRGPDTGAFHHPLFRRDEPHLCLQMVCQRSRDSRSNGGSKQGTSRSLPPKKRMLNPMIRAAVTSEAALCKPRTTLALPARAPCVVSSDDNSSASGSSQSKSSSTASSQVSLMKVAAPPSTVCTSNEVKPVAQTRPVVPFVSKDESLIQDALRQSVENERLRAAKAMLYHAYMQALGGR